MAFGNSDQVFPEGFGATCFVSDELVHGNEGFARGAERALMSALLFDGVQSFMSYALAGSRGRKARYREAFVWVTTPGNEYIFAFDNVCEGLGIDPTFLRLGLLNACAVTMNDLKKKRRNF